MSRKERTPTVETLEAKKTDLLNQIKQIDQAIKVAKEKERAKRQQVIIDALAARGLLDTDLDALLAAIAQTGRVPILGISSTEQLKAVYGDAKASPTNTAQTAQASIEPAPVAPAEQGGITEN